MTAAIQHRTHGSAHQGGSRFFASPPRTPRHRIARPEKRVAGQKTASGIFFAAPPKTRRENPSQTLGTHQENYVWAYDFASGCAVAPNRSGMSAMAIHSWSRNTQDTLGYGAGGLNPTRFQIPLGPGATQVVTGTITLVTSIPTMIAGAGLSDTGLGAIIGVPMMIGGATSFGLGLTSIANGFSGGGSVTTPNGNIPQGPFELGGAMTGNPNLQTFGGMGDSLFPLPTDWTAIGTATNILLGPPQFNPNAWPFAPSGP